MRDSEHDATWPSRGRRAAPIVHTEASVPDRLVATVASVGKDAVMPQAPTRPVEAPVETPARPGDRPDPDGGSDTETDLDDELERIIREIPDPTPQPGGE